MIDLQYVDPTNAKEIFGKQDMFQPLLQSRARVQMLDASDSGYWVVNGSERIEKYCKDNNPRAWNTHAGMKTQPINFMASAASVAHILNCV